MSKIAYLDDEKELTNIFKLLFENTHHEVSVFNDETDAIAYCNCSPPDIFFVDFRLIHFTGAQVAAQVPSSIKVVLVTGDITTDSKFSFDAIINKPFKLKELTELVEQFS